MKLLIVIPYYEPAWAYGGPPRLVSIIARQLAQRHQVTVLTTDVCDANHRATPQHENLGGVEVYRFPTWSNTLAWKTKIILPKHFKAAAAQQVAKADFVFLSDLRHYLNAAIAPALFKTRTPYSLAAYGQIQKPLDLKYPLKVLYDQVWGKRLIQQASMLLAQTQHEAVDYLTLGARPDQVQIMPLMETNPTPEELDQRGKFRAQYNIPATAQVLLFVGRLNKLKGIDLLLNSFAQLRQHQPAQDIRLVIIGRDDGYLNTMNQLIQTLQLQNVVIQPGPLYGVKNAACYLDADLFVFTPTYYEETSLATVRALSFGLPVLTTHQAELPYLDEYAAGVTVLAELDAVVKSLTELLQNATLRTQLRGNALRLFIEHYQRDRLITQLEHDIQNIIQTIPQ